MYTKCNIVNWSKHARSLPPWPPRCLWVCTSEFVRVLCQHPLNYFWYSTVHSALARGSSAYDSAWSSSLEVRAWSWQCWQGWLILSFSSVSTLAMYWIPVFWVKTHFRMRWRRWHCYFSSKSEDCGATAPEVKVCSTATTCEQDSDNLGKRGLCKISNKKRQKLKSFAYQSCLAVTDKRFPYKQANQSCKLNDKKSVRTIMHHKRLVKFPIFKTTIS